MVGTPDRQPRRAREIEGLIGFFVNTLVLRARPLAATRASASCWRGCARSTLGAYAHQDVPFERLVEELQPERDLSRSPLFQVMFVLQNAPGGAPRAAGHRRSAADRSEAARPSST